MTQPKDLINHMLVVDPKKRFTSQDVLNHPWVKDPDQAKDTQLTSFTAEMRRYNARRRFRAGVMAAKALRSMASLKKNLGAPDEKPGSPTRAGRGLGENVQVSHGVRPPAEAKE
ncbi:protein kinase [Achlya hypogyna]|uniref:Protein kinase n=1 Tax=Achlya hypogyna TaxID=1202772 RepID=A0A1V9Z2Z3_ACHHY|nr:protein kinase [Achlya hypogyna]